MLDFGLGVDFHDRPAVDDKTDQVIDESFVPVFILYAGLIGRGVLPDFIKVAENVETSCFEHTHRLVIECLDDVADVVVEVHGHVSTETVGAPVDVDHATVAVGNEVNRTDAEVEGQGGEVFVRWSPLRAEIVYLHACIEFDLRIAVANASELGEIVIDRLKTHVARRLDGNRRVWRKTVMGETGRNGRAGEVVHRRVSVAKLGMTVECIFSVVAYAV